MALDTVQKLVGDVVGGHALVSPRKEPKKTGRTYGTMGLTYPLDMGIEAPAELDNHVIFDIYIDDSTSFKSLLQQTTDGEPRSFQGHSASVAGKALSARDNLGKELRSVGDSVTEASGALGSMVKGATGSVIDSTANFVGGTFAGARNMKKLNYSIGLAVPNTFTSSSSAQYTEAKLGAIGGGLVRGLEGGISGLISKAKSAADNTQSTAAFGGEVGRLAMETLLSLPDAFGMNLQNMLEISTRRVSNPHLEQRFEAMAFREFTFTYEFSGRSKAETDAIDNIIKAFRFHMHPELVPSGLYFQYPSLFDISVRFKDNDNPYMHKISTCVLTSFTTNYTSTGVFSTNRDGQPTEIQCTMTFREIEPLHKHRIAEGF